MGGGYIDRKVLPTQREIGAEIAKLAWLTEQSDDRLLEPPEPTDSFVVYASLLAPLEQIPRFWPLEFAAAKICSRTVCERFARGPRRVAVRRGVPHGGTLARDRPRCLTSARCGTGSPRRAGDHITERTAWLIEHLEGRQSLSARSANVRDDRLAELAAIRCNWPSAIVAVVHSVCVRATWKMCSRTCRRLMLRTANS